MRYDRVASRSLRLLPPGTGAAGCGDGGRPISWQSRTGSACAVSRRPVRSRPAGTAPPIVSRITGSRARLISKPTVDRPLAMAAATVVPVPRKGSRTVSRIMVRVPSGPGLGIELNESRIERYRVA